MLIEESELDIILNNDSSIVAFILVGRVPIIGDPVLFTDGAGEELEGNIADIYLIKDLSGGAVVLGPIEVEKQTDQLFLPIGKIINPRLSGKPILKTERFNNVIVVGGGGGSA